MAKRVIVDVLGDEELQSLRKRSPGDIALEVLAQLQENNSLVWWVGSRHGRNIGFVSLTDGNPGQELDPIKKLKSHGALVSLLKRQYIAKISSSQAIVQLNQATVSAGTQAYKISAYHLNDQCTRNTPWNYYSPDIFEITLAGKQALIEFSGKLSALRAQEEKIKEQAPRFVISYRTDYNANRIGGIATAYKVVKENNTRVYIANVGPEDGFPQMNWRDNSRRTEDRTDQVAYLDRENIALMDASPEQFAALRTATLRFDEKNQRALNIKNQAILPIEQAYDASVNENCSVMKDLIDGLQKEILEAQKDLDLSAEDGFVLSIDDHTF